MLNETVMFVADSDGMVMIGTGLESISVGRILYCGICPKPFPFMKYS